MDTKTTLVSRQLRNGKQLVISVIGDQIVTTIDGVRSEAHCGGLFSAARPYKLPNPVPQSFGMATWAMGDAMGVKLALATFEAERIIAAITPPAPPKPRNPLACPLLVFCPLVGASSSPRYHSMPGFFCARRPRRWCRFVANL